jgi:hypothetical protein
MAIIYTMATVGHATRTTLVHAKPQPTGLHLNVCFIGLLLWENHHYIQNSNAQQQSNFLNTMRYSTE